MAKPRVVTEMFRWMVETGRNDIELAAELTTRLKDQGKSISPRQVFRWKHGLSYPRPAMALALEEISKGRINARTFAVDSLKKPTAEDVGNGDGG